MNFYVQQNFQISNEYDNLPGKSTTYSLVHQDKVKHPSSAQSGTKYDATATITFVSYAVAHAIYGDMKRCSVHTSITTKPLNTYKIPLSGLQRSQRSARELKVPHETVSTLNCLSDSRSLLATRCSAVITIFPQNEPLCLPRTLKRDNPNTTCLVWTFVGIRCLTVQLPWHVTLPPRSLAGEVKPHSTLTTRHTHKPCHVSKIAYQMEISNATELWRDISVATSKTIDTLQGTSNTMAYQLNAEDATKRAHDTVHQLRTRIKPASTVKHSVCSS